MLERPPRKKVLCEGQLESTLYRPCFAAAFLYDMLFAFYGDIFRSFSLGCLALQRYVFGMVLTLNICMKRRYGDEGD